MIVKAKERGEYAFIDLNGRMHFGTLAEVRALKAVEDAAILAHNQAS